MTQDHEGQVEGFYRVYKSGRIIFVAIGVIHVALFMLTAGIFARHNFVAGAFMDLGLISVTMNASMIGLIGSLLYFSRKTYTYLINDKLRRIYVQMTNDVATGEQPHGHQLLEESFRTVVWGYFYYLSLRPLAGVVIGPIVMMIVLAGLTTFGEFGASEGVILSQAGVFLLYVLAFVGGYSASNLFDYFSKLADQLIQRIQLPG